MSRFTHSPFQKPSVFDTLPRAPLSPPETHMDSSFTNTATVARGIDSHHIEMDSPSAQRTVEPMADPDIHSSPGARLRKVSTMAYVSSGLRDTRDRNPQRASKQFVVVIPPANFQHEHGVLGHTLSSGPSHRQSQGILLPLFPTFYGQLAAIAREWNFPSTAGICLYLQYTDGGITCSPRISDESWQLLWGSVFDQPPSSPVRPAIVGKLEFELDLRLARWYSAWLSSAHKEPPYDIPASIAPSEANYRRALHPEEDTPDDRSIVTRISVAPSRSRHVPKKLSLVDRFDAASVRSRATSRQGASPPDATVIYQQPHPSNLSPIQQLDEPRTARNDLASKVMSWRASASHQPTLMATKGQISLDPVNMPNSVDLKSPEDESQDEINLADFTWSISSAGPPSWDDEFDFDHESDYIASVHMDRRLQGSVCLTPSICTSFGPPDGVWSDYGEDIYSRVVTPDIALRMLDDCPPTPSTCTSFPTFSPLPSPLELSRPASVDLGQRSMFSRPVTPSTATTWGPPLSYPPSPASSYFLPTPDIAHRALSDWGDETIEDEVVPQVNPIFAGYPLFQLYPPGYPFNTHNVYPTANGTAPMIPIGPAAKGYPYNLGHIYRLAIPRQRGALTIDRGVPVKIHRAYPCFQIYAPVYPHNLRFIYPREVPNQCPTSIHAPQTGYPHFALYQAGYPHNLWSLYPRAMQDNVSPKSAGYPTFVLYPPVGPRRHPVTSPFSPHGVTRSSVPMKPLNPAHPIPPSQLQGVVIVGWREYPHLEIYPPVYPHNLSALYPPVFRLGRPLAISQYPFFQLYPSISGSGSQRMAQQEHLTTRPHCLSSTSNSAGYPFNLQDIYPQGPRGVSASSHRLRIAEYPTFELYPARYPLNLLTIYPPVMDSNVRPLAISQYPTFQLYPTPYPFNLLSIYPPKADVKDRPLAISQYPTFQLYPTRYPLNLLSVYPPKVDSKDRPLAISQYPTFQLYPTRYPLNLLSIYPRKADSKDRPLAISHCPTFQLYPPRYPLNLVSIYPSVLALEDRPLSITQYPSFQLYPLRYPFNVQNVYRTQNSLAQPSSSPSGRYPFFSIYPAMYPAFELYPRLRPVMGGVAKPRRSHAQLHRMVMAQNGEFPPSRHRRQHKTHLDLHLEVFPIMKAHDQPTTRPRLSPPIRRSLPPSAPLPPPPHMPLPSLPKSMPRRTSVSQASLQRSVSWRQNSPDSPPSLSRHASTSSNTSSPPVRHRRRDSLVLQRVRALNSAMEATERTSHSISLGRNPATDNQH